MRGARRDACQVVAPPPPPPPRGRRPGTAGRHGRLGPLAGADGARHGVFRATRPTGHGPAAAWGRPTGPAARPGAGPGPPGRRPVRTGRGQPGGVTGRGTVAGRRHAKWERAGAYGRGCGNGDEARTLGVRASSPTAVLTGFEPAASTLTGWRALQTAPQDQAFAPCCACPAARRDSTAGQGVGSNRAPGPPPPGSGGPGRRLSGQRGQGAAAVTAFTIRLSEIGYAVPRAWAK